MYATISSGGVIVAHFWSPSSFFGSWLIRCLVIQGQGWSKDRSMFAGRLYTWFLVFLI